MGQPRNQDKAGTGTENGSADAPPLPPSLPLPTFFSSSFRISLSLIAVLIALGIFQRSWSSQREQANDPAALLPRMELLPHKIGDWIGRDITPGTEVARNVGPLMIREYVRKDVTVR